MAGVQLAINDSMTMISLMPHLTTAIYMASTDHFRHL